LTENTMKYLFLELWVWLAHPRPWVPSPAPCTHLPGVLVHTCNPSCLEGGTGRSSVQDQPRLSQCETLFQKHNTQITVQGQTWQKWESLSHK
jgi:hypothetical protein